MSQGFFSGGSLEWVNFKQPTDKVKEVGIFALETLLESCLLRNKDVNLRIFLFRISFLCFLGRLFTFRVLVVLTFLIDQAFASKKI